MRKNKTFTYYYYYYYYKIKVFPCTHLFGVVVKVQAGYCVSVSFKVPLQCWILLKNTNKYKIKQNKHFNEMVLTAGLVILFSSVTITYQCAAHFSQKGP